MDKKVARHILSNCFSFFLALSLAAMTCLLTLWAGVFSKGLFRHSLEATNYYQGVKAVFYDMADAQRLPTGLPESILADLVSDAMVIRHVNEYLDACMAGQEKTFVFETLPLRNRLEERIAAYWEEQEMEPTEQQLAGGKEFTDTLEQEYVQLMKIPLLSYYTKGNALLGKVMLLGLPLCGLFTLLSAYFIFRMNRWKHRALRHIVYSTLGTALMCFLAPFLAYWSGFYERIHLSPAYFYRFLVDLVSNSFLILMSTGVCWLLISIGLIFLVRRWRKQASTKSLVGE